MKETRRVMCMIHEGSLGTAKIKQLEAVIKSTYQTHFGLNYRLVFLWLTIPDRQGYIAGKLSTASTVQLPVSDNLEAAKRHAFMAEICSKWEHITGCSKNEIILNSPDVSAAKEHFERISSRFPDASRKRHQLKLMGRMVAGYVKKGYLNASVNF